MFTFHCQLFYTPNMYKLSRYLNYKFLNLKKCLNSAGVRVFYIKINLFGIIVKSCTVFKRYSYLGKLDKEQFICKHCKPQMRTESYWYSWSLIHPHQTRKATTLHKTLKSVNKYKQDHFNSRHFRDISFITLFNIPIATF